MIKKILFGTLAVAAGVAAERKFKISENVDKFLRSVCDSASFVCDDDDEVMEDECSTDSVD